MIESITSFLEAFLYYPILDTPAIVWWLLVAAVFFTLRLKFVNIRLFKHSIDVVRGKYDNPSHEGDISHFQALSAAVSATVGLGNIAGVAIAISIGGAGAVIWMIIAGFFGMSIKYAEVTLGQKYRKKDKNGNIIGGAFYYLQDGLGGKFGKLMAIIFAIACIAGTIGAANMYQSNQLATIVTSSFGFGESAPQIISIILAFLVGVVVIGGIKRIANIAKAIVPLMAIIYITSCLVIIGFNADNIIPAFSEMFNSAFNFEAAGGGALGALVAGIKRSVFSNEAGLGSAPIAHAAAKTDIPAREGSVAILEPFIDTIVICSLTGLAIIVSGVYNQPDAGTDIILTAQAFNTVADWFDIVLTIAVVMFAYSTLISWCYYGERSWSYLFGTKYNMLYNIIFIVCIYIGGVSNPEDIINLTVALLFLMAIPNIIGLYVMSGDVAKDTDKYIKRIKG